MQQLCYYFQIYKRTDMCAQTQCKKSYIKEMELRR